MTIQDTHINDQTVRRVNNNGQPTNNSASTETIYHVWHRNRCLAKIFFSGMTSKLLSTTPSSLFGLESSFFCFSRFRLQK